MRINETKPQNKSDRFLDEILELGARVLELKTRIAKGEELLGQMPEKKSELESAIASYRRELEKLLSDKVGLMDKLKKILNEKMEELKKILEESRTLIGKALIERALGNEKRAEEFEKEANSLSGKIESLEKSIAGLQMLLSDIMEVAKLVPRCPNCGSLKVKHTTSVQQWDEYFILYKCGSCEHVWREQT